MACEYIYRSFLQLKVNQVRACLPQTLTPFIIIGKSMIEFFLSTVRKILLATLPF